MKMTPGVMKSINKFQVWFWENGYSITANWAGAWQNQQMASMSSKDSDQLAQLHSLIRAFAVFSKGSQRFQRQRRLIRQRRCVRWSDSLLGAQIILLLLLYSGSNSISSIKWAPSWENLSVQYANNKSADQPAHPHSLISTFVVHCLDSIISLVSVSKISRL